MTLYCLCDLNKRQTYLNEMKKQPYIAGQEDHFKCPICDVEVIST
jgi:hypothetical protein